MGLFTYDENNLAPIVVFVYKKLDELKKVINSLQSNDISKFSDLYIFSDAAKNNSDLRQVNEVRSFIKKISGFQTVTIFYADKNMGLRISVINGVSKILSFNDKVIVVEDDIEVSTNFLAFMNASLDFYQRNAGIFSITGYTRNFGDVDYQSDVYFTNRSISWGWGTWKDRWDRIDWDILERSDFQLSFIDRVKFNKMGSDLTSMLLAQKNGRLNSWAVIWCYHQFKHSLFSVHPINSKVRNIGFNNMASNTDDLYFEMFDSSLDISNKINFNFPSDVNLDNKIIKKFIYPYTLLSRFKRKMMNTLIKRLKL